VRHWAYLDITTGLRPSSSAENVEESEDPAGRTNVPAAGDGRTPIQIRLPMAVSSCAFLTLPERGAIRPVSAERSMLESVEGKGYIAGKSWQQMGFTKASA